ncbi:MAG: phosphatase PAP2 family protein [Euryarchaeota archaeon]|nr:phosphatase PAP2 family protein [Euryarchaeota archaeon]
MAWQLSGVTIISTLVMLALYFLAFVPEECRRKKRGYTARQLINGYWPYVLLAAAVYGLMQVQFPIQRELNLFVNYDCTHYIEYIEGGLVAVFQSHAYPVLTYMMTFVYLVLFSSVMVFTFLVLAYTEQMRALKLFSLAFVLNYLIAFPFYLLFPVTVTGYALPGVQPLMYELHPMIYEGITTVDPLDNCFPSLHAALVFSALLVISTTDLRKYSTFLTFAFLTIVFATLYLGVHWMTDVVAGVMLSLFTFHTAKYYGDPILEYLNTVAVHFERLIGVEETVVCTVCACNIVIVPHLRSVRCPQCGAVIEHSVL